jgi:hypothetical protein
LHISPNQNRKATIRLLVLPTADSETDPEDLTNPHPQTPPDAHAETNPRQHPQIQTKVQT